MPLLLLATATVGPLLPGVQLADSSSLLLLVLLLLHTTARPLLLPAWARPAGCQSLLLLPD